MSRLFEKRGGIVPNTPQESESNQQSDVQITPGDYTSPYWTENKIRVDMEQAFEKMMNAKMEDEIDAWLNMIASLKDILQYHE